MSRVTIRSFSSSQLIFNESETRIILTFLFPSRAQSIKTAKMTDSLRSFAQGVLLAAVDASYAFSFVDALFGAALRPNVAAQKVIKKFSQKALKSWFKYAKPKDLSDIKIYESVRRDIDYQFGRALGVELVSRLQNKLKVGRTHVAYFKFAHENKNTAAA